LGTEEREREREREEREKQNCGGGRELLSKQTRDEGATKRDTWRRKLKRIFAARGIRIYCNLSDTYIYLAFSRYLFCFAFSHVYFVCILKLEEDYVHVVLFCLLCGFGLV
jgi:hypothetical protein